MIKTIQVAIFRKDKERLDSTWEKDFLAHHPEMVGMQLSVAYKIEKLLNFWLTNNAFLPEDFKNKNGKPK